MNCSKKMTWVVTAQGRECTALPRRLGGVTDDRVVMVDGHPEAEKGLRTRLNPQVES